MLLELPTKEAEELNNEALRSGHCAQELKVREIGGSTGKGKFVNPACSGFVAKQERVPTKGRSHTTGAAGGCNEESCRVVYGSDTC